MKQLLSDRVKVKITVSRNMQIVGDPRYHGMTMTVLQVTNVGRRPLTIRTFGSIGLYPHKSLVAVDTQPQLPCEITEGKFIDCDREETAGLLLNFDEGAQKRTRLHTDQGDRVEESIRVGEQVAVIAVRGSQRSSVNGHSAKRWQNLSSSAFVSARHWRPSRDQFALLNFIMYRAVYFTLLVKCLTAIEYLNRLSCLRHANGRGRTQ